VVISQVIVHLYVGRYQIKIGNAGLSLATRPSQAEATQALPVGIAANAEIVIAGKL
jgi:hypothetical protein